MKSNLKQNDLFRIGPDFDLNACVGLNGGPYDFDDYAYGFFEAGNLIVQGLLRHDAFVDPLIYPLVFTYRHGVELAIKFLARQLPQLWDEEGSIEPTHKLLDNWQSVKLLLERLKDWGADDTLINDVDKIIRDFLQIDPTGIVFRYPVDRHGQRTLQDTSMINVEVFADQMQKTAEAFQGWMVMADELYQLKCESEAEYGR